MPVMLPGSRHGLTPGDVELSMGGSCKRFLHWEYMSLKPEQKGSPPHGHFEDMQTCTLNDDREHGSNCDCRKASQSRRGKLNWRWKILKREYPKALFRHDFITLPPKFRHQDSYGFYQHA